MTEKTNFAHLLKLNRKLQNLCLTSTETGMRKTRQKIERRISANRSTSSAKTHSRKQSNLTVATEYHDLSFSKPQRQDPVELLPTNLRQKYEVMG